jgi:hypothetical protein
MKACINGDARLVDPGGAIAFLPLLGKGVAKRLLLAARRETGEKESHPAVPLLHLWHLAGG